MAEAQAPETKKKSAPPRNDFNRHGLYKTTRALRMQGQNPDFVYKCFSTDPKHPSYLGRKTGEHEVGSQIGGFAVAPGWEPVQKITDPKAEFLSVRDDQGKGLDSVERYGTQVVCRMPRAQYDATYGRTEKAYQDEIEGQFYTPEKTTFTEEQDGVRGTASVKGVLSKDAAADVQELLKRA